ncbi:leukotriene B4 receptor 2b [Lepisosteus oculatus]|uniref:leukotriene B4 receptor 2b n=1 Tax=Lepisosteus oculatus TaxID=7918 RepID=UPI003718C5F0
MATNETLVPSPTPEPETIVSNDVSTAVGTLILTLVFLVGVPGNLFVIWSILVRARKRSVTCLLILHLALADGGLMLLTLFFVVYLAKRSWVFGTAMCKGLFYLCCTNMYASIFLITVMSLHRLVAVVRPHRLHLINRKAVVAPVVAALWVLTLAMAVPALVFRQDTVNREAGRGNATWVCVPVHPREWQVVFQYTFETVVGFVLPYAVIVASYVRILRRIRRTRFRRRVRSEKLILAIVITFGLFWLPYHVVNIIQVAAVLSKEPARTRLDHVWKTSRAVTSSLAFISSCANPVLYSVAARGYIHQAGLGFMARLFEGTAPDSGTYRGRTDNGLSRQASREKVGLDSLKDREADSSTSTSQGK